MNAADFYSDAWKRLAKLLNDRLSELRETNDSQTKNPIETAAIRGQIAEVKRLLALPRDASAMRSASPDEDGGGFAG